MLATVLFGRLSDKFGRKRIINISMISLLIGFVSMMVSWNLYVFIPAFFFIRFGIGGVETGVITGSADLYEDRSSSALNRLFKFSSMGSIVGPILLFLIFLVGQSWRIFFIISVIPAILFYIWFLKTDYPRGISHHEKPSVRFSDFLDPVILLGVTVLVFTDGVIIQFADWFTTYFLSFGVEVEYSVIFISAFWFSILFGQLIIQRALRRFHENKIMVFITGAAMVDIALIILTSNVIAKVVLSFLLGLISSGILPILFSIMLSRKPHMKGAIYSFMGLIGYGSIMTYHLISGYVAEYFGKDKIIFINLGAGILCFIFTILLIRYRIRDYKHNSSIRS
jgi:MFS family permease